MSSSTQYQLSALRTYFDTGITRPFAFRKAQLKRLKQAIMAHEKELYDALYADLKKSPEESWVTELGLVIAELEFMVKNLRSWMEPERVPTNLLNLPSSSLVLREPLGVVLVISPWNYPFQLLINPVVGAIAAGNCIVMKPSEFAPATSAVMKKIIIENFPPEYMLYLEGDGATVIPQLLNDFTFDHIFYTGSTAVGRSIYRMAAERLVPVTLELGGKSPCIVERDANIEVAARRIAMTKFSNAGQMCVAPDYVLVHADIRERFLEALKKTLREFFGDRPAENDNYGKIINQRQFDRITRYLQDGSVYYGGDFDREKLYIGPTILTEVNGNASVMQEEIFGPVLPVLPFSNQADAHRIIREHPNPLAFYLFTSSKQKENEWLDSVAFGGGCVNNASWHLTNHHLPFGGRGASGTGNYHGRYSFETFTHRKAVMRTPAWFDPAVKYPPLKGKLKLFKWVVR